MFSGGIKNLLIYRKEAREIFNCANFDYDQMFLVAKPRMLQILNHILIWSDSDLP